MPKFLEAREHDSGGGEESLETKEDVSEEQNKTVVLPAATNTDAQWMLTFTGSFGRKYSRGVFQKVAVARCWQLFIIQGIFLEGGDLRIYSAVPS